MSDPHSATFLTFTSSSSSCGTGRGTSLYSYEGPVRSFTSAFIVAGNMASLKSASVQHATPTSHALIAKRIEWVWLATIQLQLLQARKCDRLGETEFCWLRWLCVAVCCSGPRAYLWEGAMAGSCGKKSPRTFAHCVWWVAFGHIMAQKIHVTVARTDLCLGSSRKPSIRVWIKSPWFESHLLLYPPPPWETSSWNWSAWYLVNSTCNRLSILSLHMEEKWTNCVQCKKKKKPA